MTDQLEANIKRQGEAFQRLIQRFRTLNRVFGIAAQSPLQLSRAVREWRKERGWLRRLR
jgi:hypothetical protein